MSDFLLILVPFALGTIFSPFEINSVLFILVL